jgi:hypothetical protein
VEENMTELKNTTTKKIGKISYIITSASSKNAQKTLEKKIERMIKRNVKKSTIN